MSLWFKYTRFKEVNDTLQAVVEHGRIPSAKFIPLVWQISSRLQMRPNDPDPSDFQARFRSAASAPRMGGP